MSIRSAAVKSGTNGTQPHPVQAPADKTADKMSTVTFCIPPEEVPILEFAAKECGQTKSMFCYVLVRNRLRELGLLAMPQLPESLARKLNTNGNPNAT
jgi:hypothetical protein